MIKLEHKQTGEIIEISWHQWEISPSYQKMREFWKVIDRGDPVWFCERKANGETVRHYRLDRDHAIRSIKSNPTKFFYEEESFKSTLLRHRLKKRLTNWFNINLERFEKNKVYRTIVIISVLLGFVAAIIAIFSIL